MMNDDDSDHLCWTLEGHSRAVNCVLLSEDGKLVASGADDGLILVWSLNNGRLLQKISPKQGPVSVLRWFCNNQDSDSQCIISGGADGTIQLWKRSHQRDVFRLAGQYTVSESPVEDLVVDDNSMTIAVAAGSRVTILRIVINSQAPFELVLTEPPVTIPPKRALARRVHFHEGGRSVMVAFLDSKEIISWRISPWKEQWRDKLTTRIGNTAWSSETRLLLIWNLIDGIDVYHVVDRPVFIRKFIVKIQRNNVKQVEFAWQGKYALCGSDTGEVHIWDVQKGVKVVSLRHGDESVCVQSVMYHSPQNGRYYIASASSDQEFSTVKVWLMFNQPEKNSMNRLPRSPKEDTPRDSPYSHYRIQFTFWFTLAVLAGIIYSIYFST